MPLGTKAYWSRGLSLVACLKHGNIDNEDAKNLKESEVFQEPKAVEAKIRLDDSFSPPTIMEVAGGEARRIAEKERLKTNKKKADSRQMMYEKPILGKLLASVHDVVMNDSDFESRNAHAWKYGANGEEGVGERLNELAKQYGLYVIHDRKQGKNTSANIDHIVITSDAVYIIDARNYTGMVETETNGWINGNKPIKLKVGGRNRTNIVEGMHKQVAIVGEVLKDASATMPVIGVLAFYLADWPLFGAPTEIQGALINGKGIESIVSKPGPYTDLARRKAWIAITEALPETK